jgi:hypothetical protein
LKNKNGGVGIPEYRLPMMYFASVFVPIGLFWYGWTAEYKTFWLLPNIGAGIFGLGMMVNFLCIQNYLVDAFTIYAASAISAATVFRSLAGFGFPLFGASMYHALGNGWGNSLLAFVAIVVGIPFPPILYKYGAKWRANASKYL